MSIHPSLKGPSSLVRHRNVLTRIERIEKLQEEERWQEGDSVVGLPKVRNIKLKRKSKAKKTDDEETEGTEGEVTAAAATPPGK